MEVLRAWERRFGFPHPKRRAGSNRRLYSKADIDRLLAIRRALDHGYRVGDVIAKSLSELEAMGGSGMLAIEADASRRSADVQELIDLLAKDDVARLEDALRHAAAKVGPKRFVTDLAHPFAVAVGEAWAEGTLSVRHEHVATECLTTRLRQILASYQDLEAEPLVLLATLPGEPHALALQMVAVYLVLASAKPRLLGASTPVAEIIQATKKLGAGVVGLTVTPASDVAEARRAIRTLARELPEDVALWIGGAGAATLDLEPETARIVTTWPAVDDALDGWRTGTSSRGKSRRR
jgi:DNA-binding transcriptional MerR regulator